MKGVAAGMKSVCVAAREISDKRGGVTRGMALASAAMARHSSVTEASAA